MSKREEEYKFEFPKKFEKLLASLSIYYGQNNKKTLQKILVNSQYYLDEGYEQTPTTDGGLAYGHAIHFYVPPVIYLDIFEKVNAIEEELLNRINKITKCSGEFISAVSLEIQDDPSIEHWREDSGVLLASSPALKQPSSDELSKIWGPGYFRIFISHKSDDKKLAVELKDSLEYFGVTCFVAHEDIKPTKKWQDEIEKALFSMDAIVPLLTSEFPNSEWTDQEIGVAIGRGIPVIPIRLNLDPYGFIGKFQAVSGKKKPSDKLAKELFELLFDNPLYKARITEGLVLRFENSFSYDHANNLMGLLEKITNTTPEIINRLEKAPTKNTQVEGAYKVQSRLPILIKRLKSKINDSRSVRRRIL